MTSFTVEQLDVFLGSCRVLICMLPLTDATRGLLGRQALARLPQGAYVVNVARGALIVEDELLALIDSGHLAGAMLDVFENEPLPAGHAFWHHPGITLTPHISAATSIEHSVRQIAAKIARLEAGLPISGVIDFARDRLIRTKLGHASLAMCAWSKSARAMDCRTRRPSSPPRSR